MYLLTCRLPTDIQAESIPLILGGGDVLMAAETGSGKTGVIPQYNCITEGLLSPCAADCP
jgi:ATP-dependent RNA helicase DDX1